MANVVLKNVNKIYDNGFQAVHNFSFEIKDKEFIVFVGPSGCGKSTTLRMIAGLEKISDGELYVNDVLFNNVAPQDRDMAMVFQNYALYPHMTVFENMAFGLRNHRIKEVKLDKSGKPVKAVDKKYLNFLRKSKKSFEKAIKKADNNEAIELQKELDLIDKKINDTLKNHVVQYTYKKYPKEEIEKRVLNAAKILDIEKYLNQKPKALSGGQCQRVALGRAIVRNPILFLMDEPLSNLDAKLRVSMRSEIVSLHERIGTTTIYVTHDQTEAMTMATRIIVMNKGFIQQIGTPKEIYQHPANLFVATFIGSPSMNILPATYNRKLKSISLAKHSIKLTADYIKLIEGVFGKEIDNMKSHYSKVEANVISYYESKNEKIKNSAKHYDIKQETEKDPVLVKLRNEISNFEKQFKDGIFELLLGIRPEDVKCSKTGDIEVNTGVVELLGSQLIVHAKFNNFDIVSTLPANADIKAHSKAKVSFNLKDIHLFINNNDGKCIF